MALKAEKYERLLKYHQHLKSKLRIPSIRLTPSPGQCRLTRNFLYRCEECDQLAGLTDIQKAFTHLVIRHPVAGAKVLPRRGPFYSSHRVRRPPAVGPGALTCRYCPTISSDTIALHIHSLLHKELILFLCPFHGCTQLFGVPSKLKRHYFLDHEIVLATEEHCVVSLDTRVNLTRWATFYIFFLNYCLDYMIFLFFFRMRRPL